MLFRRTNRYGYSRYYGNGGAILRIVKIVLTLLAAAALVAVLALWGLQRFVYYDETGTHLRLPWQSAEDPTPTGGEDSSSQTLPEIIVDGPDSSAVSPEGSDGGSGAPPEEGGSGSSVAPEPQPAALPQLLAVRVERGELTDGDGPSLIQRAGGNAALVYLKVSGGTVYLPTSAPLASQLGTASSSGSAVLEQAAALQAQGYRVVAYLDCFRDSSVGASNDYALKTSGGSRWRDEDSRYWSDPANEAVQDYIATLVRELAQAGVDEVVLYNAAYPTSGSISRIAAVEDKAAVLSAFYAKLAQAAAGTELVVGVLTDSATIATGSNADSGQTLENLALLGGRLWVSDSGDAAALQSALEAAGISGDRLCLVTGSLDSSSGVSQCILN